MISLKLCRNTLIRFIAVLVIISFCLNSPAYSQESEDSQIFITGFNAYQRKDYATTITKMSEVLKKYPDSPLRDMVLFWLSRAYFKNGNQMDAARYLSQFSKEYPDNPLKGTVDDELLALTARFEKGEQLPTGSLPVVAQKESAAKERLSALKVEEDRQDAEKAAVAKRAAEEAEQARLAAVQKEQDRVAALKAEADRKAAEKAEQERLAAVKLEKERQAAEKALIAKRAAEEAEQARLAAVQKEQARVAALKAEADRQAAEKALVAKRAAEEAEQARVAALKTEAERKAAKKAEQERLAALKLEDERRAAEKAALAKRAAEEAEQARLAAAQKEQARMAALKAEAERKALAESARLAAFKIEQERKVTEMAEAERLAQEKLAMTRRAVEAAEQKRLADLTAEQGRVAAQRIEKERQATAAAEAAQQASARQEQERRANESARLTAARNRQERIETAKAEEVRQARERDAAKNSTEAKATLREKAIAQYKSILEKYPSSMAAATAAAKLKELGVSVALPQVAAVEPSSENSQILSLEVAPFAGLEFNLPAQPQAYNVAQRISIPFEIINRGNGNDSFYLESGFPAEFSAGFAAAAQPDQAIKQTTQLAPGESFKGIIHLVIPATSIDGLRINYPIKAVSRILAEATQSREVALRAAAPLLRAIVKTDKLQLLPGEKAVYRVTVLNVGSTAAEGVTLRLNFPSQLEAVDYAATGFRQEMKSALVLDGLQFKSGERREFNLTFQLKDDSLAGQELSTRAELINTPLKTAAVFVSNVAHVQEQHGVQVRTVAERQVVIPGQTVIIPLVVTNTGNVREKFRIVPTVKGAQETIIFQDLNRDGVRQSNEPVITEIGPLAPKEEANIGMEIKTSRSATDGLQGIAQVVFNSEGDAIRSTSASVPFVYSRPVLQMAMVARAGRLKPGEVASFDLTITNRGSNLARVVELEGIWPPQLELIAAEPSSSSAVNGKILWNFKELGAGEKRTIKVSFRVKAGIGVGTNVQVKNQLSYEDQLGNRY